MIKSNNAELFNPISQGNDARWSEQVCQKRRAESTGDLLNTMFQMAPAEARFVSEPENFFGEDPGSETALAAGCSDGMFKHLHPMFAGSYALVYWRLGRRLLSFHPTKQAGGGSMALRDVLSLCGRIGLIVAAFAFVAGIIAGPVLEKILFSQITVTERSPQPALPQARTPSERQTGQPG